MINKEILQASLLDIIFENRNKEYGAYALRNDYEKRLVKALGIGLGAVLLFILFNFLKFGGASSSHSKKDKGEITIKTYEVQPDKPKEPELPRPIEKPRPGQIANVTPTIVEDEKANNKTPEQDDIEKGDVSTITTGGAPDGNPSPINLMPSSNGNGEVKIKEPEQPAPKIIQRAPQYPGGLEALTEFMRRNLVTPEEIEVGMKKIVRVKFMVGADGSITDVTILESPGKIYDKEVTRVIRKMPRWEPAIQNDINVATSFILPVTFISEEE
jgi:protein TonB